MEDSKKALNIIKIHGKVSKGPKNGQKALDESIATEDGKWRVAIENGKIIVFEKTSDGVYHGYVIENPANLHQDIKNTLFKEGWIRAPNNFKIIKK